MGRLIGQRSSGLFLLNGDRYSPTTSKHQWDVRRAVSRIGIPSVIIPYSALAAAGVVLDSIRPLDVQEDRTERWTEDIGEAWHLDTPGAFTHDEPQPLAWTENPDAPEARSRRWQRPGSGGVHAVELLRGFDYAEGGWRDYAPGENVNYYTANGSRVEVENGRFRVERWQHFLGACVFTARVTGRERRVKFISAFDENERRPLYFLAELPRCSARTYEEALDALAPRIVHAALAQSRDVTRQGDIFAIPTELDKRALRKRGARFVSRSNPTFTGGPGGLLSDARLLGTDHIATEVAKVGRAVYARGCLYHDPGFRTQDHARRRMGDGRTWHLIVRNTVPRSRRVTAGARW
jgi:hypothetical protein